MEIKWLGAAGFQISTGQDTFLVDPYLSRNPDARPVPGIKPSDIPTASRIFISHGHFDHVLDVPEIVENTGAHVYCAFDTRSDFIRRGVSPDLIHPVQTAPTIFEFSQFKARAFFSRHIRFDLPLILSTLLKTNIRSFQYLPLIRAFPCGRVLSWRFEVEGRVILFFGSAGESSEELDHIHDRPIDILLLPLQGHSNICRIGLDYVRCLTPRMVIPHHHDDFFPPISRTVDIRPFVQAVQKECPGTQVRVLEMNRPEIL